MLDYHKGMFAKGTQARDALERTLADEASSSNILQAVVRLSDLLRKCILKAWRNAGHGAGAKSGQSAPWWNDV